MSQLYIPKKIKVGYQNRSDTYTGKLSYIVYFDDKGVLRKETSWNGWRDKKIESEEFVNEPTTGFVLHKDIKRYSWSHFSSKRTLIRVYDPRGMEFEITTENLLGILMSDDCCKRQLVGSYVYSWSGPELVLLPTCSEEYQQATTYTALQAGKIGAKDLIPGCGYKTKKQVDLTYVGRYDWHALRGYSSGKRETKKYYIFVRPGIKDDYESKWHWELKSSLDFLAAKTTEQPVENFATIVEAFQKNIHSAKIVKWEAVPTEVSTKTVKSTYAFYADSLKRTVYHKLEGDTLTEHSVSADWKSVNKDGQTTHELQGYHVSEQYIFDIKTQTITERPRQSYQSWSYHERVQQKPITAEQLQAYGLCDLFVILDNGRRVKLDHIHNI